MAFSTEMSVDGNEITFYIDGCFDFKMHADFRAAYQNLPSTMRFIIDLEKTKSMDSSAMGMLLLLREHAGGKAANITLQNCNAGLRKTLSISHLEKLFTLKL